MTLFERVFSGNDTVYALTEQAVDAAIAQYGEEKAVGFPDTAYSLPCCYAVTGAEVSSLKEMKAAMGVVKSLMTRRKRMNDVFLSGVATALCAEFIEAIKYIDNTPYEAPCCGHLGDATIRETLAGNVPGIAVILGTAPSEEDAAILIQSYQEKGVLVTLVGGVIDQLEGAENVLCLGRDVTAVVHAVSFALRAALMFGNIKPGDAESLMQYTLDLVPAFVNAFAPMDDVTVACGAGGIALGFPVITNETENIDRVPKSLIVQENVGKFCQTSLEARDIKL